MPKIGNNANAAPVDPKVARKAQLKTAVHDVAQGSLNRIIEDFPLAVSASVVVHYRDHEGGVEVEQVIGVQKNVDEKVAMTAMVKGWLDVAEELAKNGALGEDILASFEAAHGKIRLALAAAATSAE